MAMRDEGCRRLGRTLVELHTDLRVRHIVYDRQVIMAACRLGTPASFPELGRVFARHHTTVQHDVRETARRRDLGLLNAEQIRFLEWAESYRPDASQNGSQPTRRQ